MARLSIRERRTFLALSALYAAVVVPISIHKGADLELHLELASRLLRQQPLYITQPPFGNWWPPVALIAIAPFAGLAHWSLALAKGSFAVASVACLAYAVMRSVPESGSPAVALALAAVAVPLQTNFEYLNLNAPLLALLTLGALDLRAGRETRAGVWIGLMAALKAFPALLFAYLAYRRYWRGMAVGILVAVILTLAAVLPYGPTAGATTLGHWFTLSLAGVADMHGRSQSLPALLFRLGTPFPWAAAVELGALVVVLLALRNRTADSGAELAIMMLLAVFLSPVAHTHYYLLAYPAWLALLARRPPVANRAVWYSALGLAGVLTSGFLTLGSHQWRGSVLATSPYAWGGLLLLLLLLVRPPVASPSPSPSPKTASEL